MAKLVDASALGADESNLVEVRVLFPAPLGFWVFMTRILVIVVDENIAFNLLGTD